MKQEMKKLWGILKPRKNQSNLIEFYTLAGEILNTLDKDEKMPTLDELVGQIQALTETIALSGVPHKVTPLFTEEESYKTEEIKINIPRWMEFCIQYSFARPYIDKPDLIEVIDLSYEVVVSAIITK
jgi:hypothetical protein